MSRSLNEWSRLLALVLRHKPEAIGINLDEHGWAQVEELLAAFNRIESFNFLMLEQLVAQDDKQRFASVFVAQFSSKDRPYTAPQQCRSHGKPLHCGAVRYAEILLVERLGTTNNDPIVPKQQAAHGTDQSNGNQIGIRMLHCIRKFITYFGCKITVFALPSQWIMPPKIWTKLLFPIQNNHVYR